MRGLTGCWNQLASKRLAKEFCGQSGRLISVGMLFFVLSVAAGDVRATPIISEIFYDATGSDDGFGFVELHGTPGTSLDGPLVAMLL